MSKVERCFARCGKLTCSGRCIHTISKYVHMHKCANCLKAQQNRPGDCELCGGIHEARETGGFKVQGCPEIPVGVTVMVNPNEIGVTGPQGFFKTLTRIRDLIAPDP